MKKTVKLSIVIPVYNEKENILKTLTQIKKHIKVTHEVLIIYDFKEDTTLDVFAKSKRKFPTVKLIKNIVHRGPSGAIRTGIIRAKGSLVLVTMADLCDDLSQVTKMIHLMPKEGGIICPSRYCKGGQQQLNASLKVWMPRSAGFLLKYLGGLPTYDPTNSYKLYSRNIFSKIRLQSEVSFSVTLEIVVKANALKFTIIEIPTIWRDRQHGKTNFKLWRSIVAYLPWFLYAFRNRFS